jgi:hypothetical protein
MIIEKTLAYYIEYRRKSMATPFDQEQIWFRQFFNEAGQLVMFQLYSGSGGFTYNNRQFLGKLFGGLDPKGNMQFQLYFFHDMEPPGYWVSRESFDAGMKRKRILSTGKLKSNAWTVSALVSQTATDSIDCTEEEISQREKELIQMVSNAKEYVIAAIHSEPGLEHTKINFVEVNLMDQTLSYHENQLNALGFFATNKVEQNKKLFDDESAGQLLDTSSQPFVMTAESTTKHRRVTIGR